VTALATVQAAHCAALPVGVTQPFGHGVLGLGSAQPVRPALHDCSVELLHRVCPFVHTAGGHVTFVRSQFAPQLFSI